MLKNKFQDVKTIIFVCYQEVYEAHDSAQA